MADEVARLLANSNPTERSLALKLASVDRNHLYQALLHPDDLGLRRQALDHPSMDGATLLAYLQNPIIKEQQAASDTVAAVLQHPQASRDHVEAAYDLNLGGAAAQAIAQHHALPVHLQHQLLEDPEKRQALLQNPHVHANVLRRYVESMDDPLVYMDQRHVFLHPNMPDDLFLEHLKAADPLSKFEGELATFMKGVNLDDLLDHDCQDIDDGYGEELMVEIDPREVLRNGGHR